jgi:hypothetical protein
MTVRGVVMGKIVIGAQTDKVDAVADLRKHLPNKSVGDIRHALTTGAPLVDRLLFFNDHEEAAAQLLAVIADLQKHGIEPRVYDLDEDEDVTTLIDADKQSSVQRLHNMLERHEQIAAQQRRNDNDK